MARERYDGPNEALRKIARNYPKVSISGKVIKVPEGEQVGLGFWSAVDYLESHCGYICQNARMS